MERRLLTVKNFWSGVKERETSISQAFVFGRRGQIEVYPSEEIRESQVQVFFNQWAQRARAYYISPLSLFSSVLLSTNIAGKQLPGAPLLEEYKDLLLEEANTTIPDAMQMRENVGRRYSFVQKKILMRAVRNDQRLAQSIEDYTSAIRETSPSI